MENETEYFTTETPKYLFKEKTISSYDVHFDVKNVKCHKWDISSGAVVPAGCDEPTINTITCVKLNLKIIYPNFSKDWK